MSVTVNVISTRFKQSYGLNHAHCLLTYAHCLLTWVLQGTLFLRALNNPTDLTTPTAYSHTVNVPKLKYDRSRLVRNFSELLISINEKRGAGRQLPFYEYFTGMIVPSYEICLVTIGQVCYVQQTLNIPDNWMSQSNC